jgi:hypothetical protein
MGPESKIALNEMSDPGNVPGSTRFADLDPVRNYIFYPCLFKEAIKTSYKYLTNHVIHAQTE